MTPSMGTFVYFSHTTLQVPRVARQCMVALCEGAAGSGAESEIVSVRVRVHPAEQVHPPFEQLYQLEVPVLHTSFSIPWVTANDSGMLSRCLRLAAYTVFGAKLAFKNRKSDQLPRILSARNYSVLAMLAVIKRLLRAPWVVLADVHGPCRTRFQRWVHRFVDGNVCITQHLANHLQEQCSLRSQRVRVAHSGVKPERFRSEQTKAEAAALLGLKRDRPIICYTGKVYYRYEEVAYLIEVARLLGEEITLVIVGGRPDMIPPWQAECAKAGVTNVVFTGFQPPSRIPTYLRAADLLVLYYPPSPLNDYRSPGKLFEYLASGTPLVASRFRGVVEIVEDGVNGFLVEPYQPDLLAERIRTVLQERSRWDEVGRQAVATAERYTWKVRASTFLDYAERLQQLEACNRSS